MKRWQQTLYLCKGKAQCIEWQDTQIHCHCATVQRKLHQNNYIPTKTRI